MIKIVRLLATIILLVFAGFQYNDPDPWLWMPLYGLGAVIAFSFFRGKMGLLDLSFVYIIFCLVFSMYNWPDVWMGFEQTNPPNINVEKTRESCGLLIAGTLVAISIKAK